MCGEKSVKPLPRLTTMGSPPHVRGKARPIRLEDLVARITPACAGKSFLCCLSHQNDGDHPRMCGEKPSCTAIQTGLVGSPPHVRGKVQRALGHSSPVGITPACAGKRTIINTFRNAAEDHPRMCGEKGRNSAICAFGMGSPPHVRGKGKGKIEPGDA